MPSPETRRHAGSAPPAMSAWRWMLVAVAVAVCMLSVAGAFRLGPGAALADTETARNKQPERSADEGDGTARDEAATDATNEAGDDWLTYNDSPDRQSDDGADPDTQDVALPARSGNGKRVVYSESRQRVWLVGPADHVARTYRVSGSRFEDNVRPGHYEVYSTSRHAISYDYLETMNYMVRFTTGDTSAIGFHDLPRYKKSGALAQTRAQLGQPLSAGCVRQWSGDAKALWDFAPVGTTVVVTA